MNGMKLKFFLRGLGVGIVVTALIFSIGYRMNRSDVNVVEQAKELGMVFPEGTAVPTLPTDKPDDGASDNDKTDVPEEEGSEQKETDNPSTTEPPDKTVNPDKTEEPDKTKNPSQTDTNTKGVRFTVREGLLSSSVARELKEAGIIKSDKELDRYLEKSGYAREIRSGTYFIPAGASYEEIARIITRRD